MMKPTQLNHTALLILIGLLLVGFVSAGGVTEVRDYWLERGLDNESATRISLGVANEEDIEKAHAIENLEDTAIAEALNETLRLIAAQEEKEMKDVVGFLFICFLLLMIVVAICVVIWCWVRGRP